MSKPGRKLCSTRTEVIASGRSTFSRAAAFFVRPRANRRPSARRRRVRGKCVGTVLQDPELEDELLCFVVDLFSPEGGRPVDPRGSGSSPMGPDPRQSSRAKNSTSNANTGSGGPRPPCSAPPSGRSDGPGADLRLLEGVRHRTTLLHLSYRAPVHEAGPEKAFDFSRTTLADRWESGFSRHGGGGRHRIRHDRTAERLLDPPHSSSCTGSD